MKDIVRRVISFTVYAAVIVIASYGLAVFYDWIWLPSGEGLSQNQFRNSRDFALTFGIGFSLGEQLRQRSKPKEQRQAGDA